MSPRGPAHWPSRPKSRPNSAPSPAYGPTCLTHPTVKAGRSSTRAWSAFFRNCVAVVPKAARKARAKAAEPPNPQSSAISVTLRPGVRRSWLAARSSRHAAVSGGRGAPMRRGRILPPWPWNCAPGPRMESFAWNPSFETHVGDVDAQHRRLVDLINGLGTLLAEGGELPAGELERTHRELVAYADYHFREEERLMDQMAVDARHQEQHRRQHQVFREFVSEAIEAGGRDAAAEENRLLSYLVHWLTYHILGVDQGLARQIHAIGAGASPAQAYAHEGENDDTATLLLLRSVAELFETLSGRNRELTELNRTLEERVADRTQALSTANAELQQVLTKVERMAMTDSLTGLPNRRYAMRRLASAWAAAVRHGRGLGCLLIDADGFKQVNDACGHEAGNRVLVELAQALRQAARESDEVCRLGGDEFLVVCPETSLEGTLALGERLRAAVAAMRVELTGGAWDGSVSVGAAALGERMSSFEELLRAADAGVYQAKRLGRNRVEAAGVQGGAPA